MKKILTAVLTACLYMIILPVQAEQAHLVWIGMDDKDYWYEHDVRQGVYGDPKNIRDTVYDVERGREIYDPGSDGWYWLDANANGAKAVNKEVWMPYIYQEDFAKGINKQGKWVRYNESGKMIKGWYTTVGSDVFRYTEHFRNVYYYDLITGEMYKGNRTINGVQYHFNELTGVLENYTDITAPEDLKEFLSHFLLGYGNSQGPLYYSSSNPMLNSELITRSLIAPFLSCVDYTVGPQSFIAKTVDGPDPRGWFNSYKKYDVEKIQWLRENVLNMSETDFDFLFMVGEDLGECYKYDFAEGSCYVCEYGIYGLEDPVNYLSINNVKVAGDIYFVDYDLYELVWNENLADWVAKDTPYGRYYAVLWKKSFNKSPYWSIIANGCFPKG